jgi:hypothetical protein
VLALQKAALQAVHHLAALAKAHAVNTSWLTQLRTDNTGLTCHACSLQNLLFRLYTTTLAPTTKLTLSTARTTCVTVAFGTLISCGTKLSAIVQQPAMNSSSSSGE